MMNAPPPGGVFNKDVIVEGEDTRNVSKVTVAGMYVQGDSLCKSVGKWELFAAQDR